MSDSFEIYLKVNRVFFVIMGLLRKWNLCSLDAHSDLSRVE